MKVWCYCRILIINRIFAVFYVKFYKMIMNKVMYNQLFVCLFGVLLFSCCNNPTEDTSKKRNILFYIGADSNGLDNRSGGDEPKRKIDQIRAGWRPGNGKMLIYTDQTNREAYLLLINETKGADGLYGLDTVRTYRDANSADPEMLSHVINEVVQGYPADSYGMIFFSHASGWLPYNMLNHPRSLVVDNGDGARSEMEYYDFAAAIPDKLFDFIILEACLMADVMSMYELRNKAEYVLASSAEILSPGFGGTNNGFTTEIYKNEIMRLFDTKSQIRLAVSGFAQTYYDYISSSFPETDLRNSATLSLIKMDEMENLASTTKALLQGVDIDEANLIVGSIQSFDRPNWLISSGYRRSRYFDFAHSIESLVSESDYRAFKTQIEKTVVWKASTKNFLLNDYGFYVNHHSGLTTYITQDVFPELNAAYRNSSWYKAIY